MAGRRVRNRLVGGTERAGTALAAGLPCHAVGAQTAVLPSGGRVAGVDEAGRGCLAGPVVAAAVILPADFVLPGLTDSKLLSPPARARLAEAIRAIAVAYAIAAVEASEIDATDILRATLRAMASAVHGLSVGPELVLVDGNVLPRLTVPARAVVGGDRLVPAISAASILAKVTRDATMVEWDGRFPGYGFAQHKGYGTAAHLDSIVRHGPCPIHRKTFAGVREHVAGAGGQGSLW
jgi:ribonuclease HII